ncbi:MAG TPA: hypothetical protein VIL28_10220 [Steroidobacteraceae bacterium]|jgi:hypothetical protein
MAVPWLQIVQLVPSIVEVSRELLKKNKRTAEQDAPQTPSDVVARIQSLEENERRQAELISQMAEQLANMTKLILELRKRVIWLAAGLAVAIGVAVVALFVRL